MMTAVNLPSEVLSSLPGKDTLPDVFLGYQKRLSKLMSESSVVVCEKSRRIGVTWGIAGHAVLVSASAKGAGGMDTFYIGFNLDMTKEFIDTCADWAKSFASLAAEVNEFMFEDQDENKQTKFIQAFRIKFDSGFAIVALTSRPRSLRGRQGFVIIDEAAFHDDLPELMKAALAMLIWGGKVLVISTHDGVDNAFNQIILDIRAGRKPYKILKIDLDDALKDGLYRRICLVAKREWSPEAEEEWRQELMDFYGEGADEELLCIPRKSAGAYLPSQLVESCMDKTVPVIRLEKKNEFVYLPEHERVKDIHDWCEETLRPLLNALDPSLRHHLGGDFARNGDLSYFWPLAVSKNLQRITPFALELRNIPFAQQRQILWFILGGLPNFTSAALDARGNGQQLAEETMQKYGAHCIFTVMTSVKWYLDALPKYKAALEDGLLTLPADDDILGDNRLAIVSKGIPQIPDKRTKGKDGGQRHGDALIAATMAYWSTVQEIMEYGYQPVSGHVAHSSFDRPDTTRDSDFNGGRFNAQKGAF